VAAWKTHVAGRRGGKKDRRQNLGGLEAEKRVLADFCEIINLIGISLPA
jgi:hypothetical protein